MIRKGKQGKRKIVKGNDVAAFIGVLFDLFSYNHYKKRNRTLSELLRVTYKYLYCNCMYMGNVVKINIIAYLNAQLGK